MARQLEDLAKEAKANGGDAIIMGGKDTKYLGSINTGGTSVTSGTAQTFGNNTYYNSTSYNSGGLSMAAMRQNTQAFVIKYL
jgi:dihydrodipicolinate synthase/N-acetylneuraminate lyase